MGTDLKTLAGKMIEHMQNIANGWVQQPLADGARLVLQRNGDSWRLAVGVEFGQPQEIELLREAFRVPEGTEQKAAVREWTHPKTLRRIKWNVIEMRWIQPA